MYPWHERPGMADMMHVVRVMDYRFVVCLGSTGLTEWFTHSEAEWALWREQPWVDPERPLSAD